MPPTQDIPLDYPDVLGTITGGPRFNVDVLQCAFAMYPPSTTIGQPFEALVLLQNTCDKPIQVQVTLQSPRKDSNGNRMVFVSPKDEAVIGIQPGETGLLHIPIVPHLPTQASENNTMSVRVRVKAPGKYKLVRQPSGGRAATALNMSPFRLNILREVNFGATSSEPEVMLAPFNIIPGHMENIPVNAPRYETLWSVKELQNEQAAYKENFVAAERFAAQISRAMVYNSLIDITEQRFNSVGFPVHPGEALFIAKTLTYVMEEGLELEEGFKLTEGRWFHRLVSIMQDEFILKDADKLCNFLYTAVVYDAVRVGLNIVERAGKQKFGTQADHMNYADEVVLALEGRTPVDLGHVYLPLALAGALLNQQVKGPKENLWESIDGMREAWRGRVRLAGSEFDLVNKLLDSFLYEAEQFLYRSRIPRS